MGRVTEFWGDTRVPRMAVGDWVAAEPFRAWTLELLASGGLSLAELAELALVSRQVLHRLLHGRPDGSALRKISPDVARRLLRVRSVDVTGLEARTVPSALVIGALVDLLADDGRVDTLARRLGVDEDELWSVVRGAPDCRTWLAVRVRTAAEDLRADQFRRRPPPADPVGYAQVQPGTAA